jgi:uncharacterized protein YqhQ
VRVKKVYYGGQAVVDGVMMRGLTQATTVVRAPDGNMISRTERLPGAVRSTAARLPLIRGLVALWEMLILGTRMMLFSARVHSGLENREISTRSVQVMIGFSVGMVVALFFVFPLLVSRAAGGLIHGALFGNVVEGVLRLALFLIYLALVARLPQMYRVFQYHGAEHKTINAYEAGAPLTPGSVQEFSTLHVRCGTAFLLWVAALSIVVFALIGHPPFLIGILSRIVLVPLIAALGYEMLRLGARFYGYAPVRLVMQPGLWLQYLTTREPSDDQVEVAIAALRAVLSADGRLAEPPPSTQAARLAP